MDSQETALQEISQQYRQLLQEYHQTQDQVSSLRRQREVLESELKKKEEMLEAESKSALDWYTMYQVISDARYWKATKPLRMMTAGMKSAVRWGARCLQDPGWLSEGMRSLKEGGISGLRARLLASESQAQTTAPVYEKWYEEHRVTAAELEREAAIVFREMPLISILVPAYRTTEKFLRAMIESLRAQSYSNWELCLADASENDSDVLPVVREYQAKDGRIRYQRITENRGIPENTNEALAMAEGDYIGLLDHSDLLAPNALFEVVKAINEDPAREAIYTDEDKISSDGSLHREPHFKPDYDLDLLRSTNYISHFFVVKRSVAEWVGGFRREYNGSQDYDFIFRCTEQAEKTHHIPEVLYHWRISENSTAENIENKLYCFEAGKKAIEDHLERTGETATVDYTNHLGYYRVTYEVKEQPLISIVIPNRDEAQTLRACLESIWAKTTYPNYEILIVENNSEKRETLEYYRELKGKPGVRLLRWPDEFNYSAINNFAVRQAKGEYILLLNNDMELITPNWLELMLGMCQREDVGIVGCKLIYPDDTIQHAGVILGMSGLADHAFPGLPAGAIGYCNRPNLQQDLSAVTAACLMVKKSIYDEVGGMEERLKVEFNDVDFCLKVRKAGYLVVYEPNVQLYHYESKSRGQDDTPEKRERWANEVKFVSTRWKDILEKGDPYYNRNLSLVGGNFAIGREEN